MINFKTFIAGVGNPYRHDDGIGIEIIKILQQENNPQVVLFDGGTDGLSLIDQLVLYKKALIIDAVYMNENPGVIKVFTPKEARLKIKGDTLSTHGFGLAEVLKLAEKLGVKTAIKIIGIEPLDISFGEGLSKIVKEQIPRILSLIKSIW
jgi:hydrogenase maturation protease